jgi:hypothetical protein
MLITGDHQNIDIGILLLDEAEQLETVHFGHDNVRNDDREMGSFH